jgi:hypothetical protein
MNTSYEFIRAGLSRASLHGGANVGDTLAFGYPPGITCPVTMLLLVNAQAL